VPELPEVETVRRGLERGVAGRAVVDVAVGHPRAVRRHVAGAPDFVARLTGRTVLSVRRRGKYLWLPLDSGDALTGHLGMSGQLLVVPPDSPLQKHLHVRMRLSDSHLPGGRELRFVDQRTFGGLLVVPDGDPVPPLLAHIARDPLDPEFDDERFVEAVRRRRTGIKRALLDQTLVSGLGNIYADETLWRAGLHGARPTELLTRPAVRRLLAHARDVLREAVQAGGTSFDALYISADGVSGLFEQSLNAYGREGEPCPRCGTPIRREAFMNRSSFSCPRCQPRPRAARP
jgi:formamidopyrimidine-DNA glycosylase